MIINNNDYYYYLLQHALRLIAFRQIYKILGVDPLPQRNRKRRIDSENENSMEADSDVKKEKKDQNSGEESPDYGNGIEPPKNVADSS